MKKRKTRSLYGKYFNHANLKEQTWLQSEKLPSYLEFYVREDLIQGLKSNSNHLIVGRRGTGKTHLLGAFNESINQENKHSLSMLISAIDFTGTPLEFIDESTEFARAKYSRILFDDFLHIFISRFIDLIDPLMEKEKLTKKQRETIEEKELSILEEIENGSLVRKSVQVKKVAKKSQAEKKTSKKKMHAGAKISFSANPLSLGLGGEGESDSDTEKDESDEFMSEEVYQAESKIFKIKSQIRDILTILKIQTLYILIDEWMELDKNLNLGIQPYFAQLLKRVFFNDRFFSVKIASVWHRTDLYNKLDLDKSRGLEIGDDIELGADLDTAFISNEEEIVDFFKEMLFRRIAYRVPEISDFHKNESVDDILIEELFETQENFKTLIAVSHGIPRKFWNIFNKCSSIIKNNFTEYAVTREIICEVAQKIYLLEKRKTLEENSDSQRLWNQINEYMQHTENRHFVIENMHVKHSPLLRKLIDEELIHQIPSALTPRQIRDTHKAFMIDYGNYIDWLHSRSRSIEDALDAEITPQFYKNKSCDLGNYIDLYEALYSRELLCINPGCGQKVDAGHPVYRKFNVCPQCGTDIPAPQSDN